MFTTMHLIICTMGRPGSAHPAAGAQSEEAQAAQPPVHPGQEAQSAAHGSRQGQPRALPKPITPLHVSNFPWSRWVIYVPGFPLTGRCSRALHGYQDMAQMQRYHVRISILQKQMLKWLDQPILPSQHGVHDVSSAQHPSHPCSSLMVLGSVSWLLSLHLPMFIPPR